jgi:hypothetical protein
MLNKSNLTACESLKTLNRHNTIIFAFTILSSGDLARVTIGDIFE